MGMLDFAFGTGGRRRPTTAVPPGKTGGVVDTGGLGKRRLSGIDEGIEASVPDSAL